jgi:hypothetical protein
LAYGKGGAISVPFFLQNIEARYQSFSNQFILSLNFFLAYQFVFRKFGKKGGLTPFTLV